jgi:hypothetical protein
MQDIFKTTDLPLASFLKCKGVQLADDYNYRTKEWSFKDEDKCKELSLALTNGEALVNVLEYEMHRKSLLSIAKRTKSD